MCKEQTEQHAAILSHNIITCAHRRGDIKIYDQFTENLLCAQLISTIDAGEMQDTALSTDALCKVYEATKNASAEEIRDRYKSSLQGREGTIFEKAANNYLVADARTQSYIRSQLLTRLKRVIQA